MRVTYDIFVKDHFRFQISCIMNINKEAATLF